MTCLAILVCLFAASPDGGRDRGPQDPFVAYLSTHDVPKSQAELTALGARPADDFMRIAAAHTQPPLIRARAMAALRYLPSHAVQTFVATWIEKYATHQGIPERLILRRAARVLGWLGGPSSVERLATLFQNEDPEVRIDAVLALSLTRSQAATFQLHRQKENETSERVRNLIEKQLKLLEPALETPPPAPKPKSKPMRTDF